MILTFRPIEEWPEGWDRSRGARDFSPFSASYSATLELLERELIHLRATQVTLQVDATDRDCRLDGQLRADAKVGYHGCILSFTTPTLGALSYPCNAYAGRFGMPGWQANLRAIALGLEALRKVERYGIAERGQQYAGFAQLGSGVAMGASLDHAMTVEEAERILLEGAGAQYEPPVLVGHAQRIDACYRRAVKLHHPDAGGDPDVFRRLTEARDLLLEATS